jgi:hypothetical protein
MSAAAASPYSSTVVLKVEWLAADHQEVSSAAGYDPKIIERFADQLLRKADTVRVGCAVGGGIFGVCVGAVPLTPLKSVWGLPAGFGVATIIVGALVGILIGWVIGEGRAFRYRVQAQSAIFQLEIERRVTSAVAEAVATAAAQAAPVVEEPAKPPSLPPLSPVIESAPPVDERVATVTAQAAPVLEEPAELPSPPLSPVIESARPTEPLLRPPGAPLPPVSPTPDEPPLSPPAVAESHQ